MYEPEPALIRHKYHILGLYCFAVTGVKLRLYPSLRVHVE